MSNVSARSSEVGVAPRPSLTQRALGAYLGLAVGDALGATTEFMTPNEIRHQYGVHDRIRGGGWLNLKPGQVTDDTEMSLALGNSILRNRGVVGEQVAEAFSAWMRGKPVDIGNTVRRGIVHYRTSGQSEVPVNKHDAGNGACMRCLPIALFYRARSDEELLRASRVQAHTTHNNPVADAGTETVLRMLVAAFNQQPKPVLRSIADRLVEQHAAFRFERSAVNNPSGWIVETLQVVFQGFFQQEDFASTLVDVVNRGGDSDTSGAIAGMLAGALYGVDAIPAKWLQALDARKKNECAEQAVALLSSTG